MPPVAPNLALQGALNSYMERSGSNNARTASDLGIDPMTLGRFIKSGRVIERNRAKIAEGLARMGAWDVGAPARAISQSRDHDVISNEKVIASLEFLLDAARSYHSRLSNPPT